MELTGIFKLLKEKFGYESFRPLQEDVVACILSSRDAVVLMPTGGGKSLCYQLPALSFTGLTVVISPLISLMKDQVDDLRSNGVTASYINSSLKEKEIAAIQKLALLGKLKILYIAPERLALPEFKDFLHALNVSLFAIDEAHCISEWGHDFRPDYRKLRALRGEFPKVPIIALTATATPRVRQDIVNQLGLTDPGIFVSSFDRPNLRYLVEPKTGYQERLIELLSKYRGEPVIIYCFSRVDCDRMAEKLRAHDFEARAYHAGMTAQERTQVQEAFIRDEVPIVCATIAFGMGINKPDVRLVAHLDLPKSVEGYYQETGRAGRDGLPAECVLFFSRGDMRKQLRFIDEMEDESARRRANLQLQQIVSYGEHILCRRKFLLKYFGEERTAEQCENCDNCSSPKESFDATELVQKIISAIMRTGERFGTWHIIKVLRGEDDEKIKARGHDSLSVFGIARDREAQALKHYIQQLLHRGLLAVVGDEYPVLQLTEEGKAFIKERKAISLAFYRHTAPGGRQKSGEPVNYDKELFENLRALRRRIALTHGIPPYLVFGNRTLQQMAREFPKTREDLSKIFGVGAEKLSQYGDAFLHMIKKHVDSDNI